MGGSENMVSPENALPGREAKQRVDKQHYVLGTAMEAPWPQGFKVACFANGCFWGSEKGTCPRPRPSEQLLSSDP